MWYCVPAGQGGILGYLLDSRLRGNDMPGLAHLAGAGCIVPANHYCLRCIRVGTLPIVAQTLQRNRLT